MLKSLELSGFKSFADRTRMDFAQGISALVGPNGSGKSNIVDAIKWVLGEQSVKKLRGGEMTDVIFNGSETRPAATMAEVTLTFDNAEGFLQFDSPTVAITRRVYRSGESEYLINRQGARLKDIRELLSGTGLGLQAYSIIEQGRVELLLQSTSAQRRSVLEEAAGVARFNAKKQEVTRRLEKVEQNMVRLSDIVSELETQLRTTKSQAGKAQLYRQYTERLRTLRTELGLIQWRGRYKKAEEYRLQLGKLTAESQVAENKRAEAETENSGQVKRLEQLDARLLALDGEIVQLRENIASIESAAELQYSQLDSLDEEIVKHGRQLLEINSNRGDLENLMLKTDQSILEARGRLRRAAQRFDTGTLRQEILGRKLELLTGRGEELAQTLRESTLSSERLEIELGTMRQRRNNLLDTQKNKNEQLGNLRCQLAESVNNQGTIRGGITTLVSQIRRNEETKRELTTRKENLSERRRVQSQEHEEKKLRLLGMNERISLLEDLLRKKDGLGEGVQEILTRAADPTGPFRHVHGLVADLIRVNVEAAHIIELALGADAEHIVVSPDPELFRYIEENEQSFAGKVSFIWPERHPKDEQRLAPGVYDGVPGVLGRADRFVETDPEFEHLVWRLLGRTWIVESLSVAKKLYKKSDGRTNFITLAGQALNANGTFVVGPAQSSGGWITRRSELRQLLDERATLKSQITSGTRKLRTLDKALQGVDQQLGTIDKDLAEENRSLDDIRLRRVKNGQQRRSIKRDLKALNKEIDQAAAEAARLAPLIDQAQARLDELRVQTEETRLEAERIERKRAITEQRCGAETEETNALKIEKAKSETELELLKKSRREYEQTRSGQQKILETHRSRCDELSARRQACELTILADGGALADLYSQKEEKVRQRNDLYRVRCKLAAAKKQTESQIRRCEQKISGNREQSFKLSGSIEALENENHTLADRLMEDYGVDLEEANRRFEELRARAEAESADHLPAEDNPVPDDPGAAAPPDGSVTPEEELDEIDELDEANFDQEAYQREINDLKQKLGRIGNVNLEAIDALESLERRYKAFSGQYNDLMRARKAIQRLIDRVNVDSQRLFDETFDEVKIYFNEIFQKLFGGGHADLVFEDPDHPMESGIDILVRPPGKDLRNVMLLSGGEKTLTCVAFLLAIFRCHAGPVCILDEVDAALDEGNVGRFTTVIQEFKTDTQFLIITHSKKTMMCTKTMYGITMQDPGVSKLVSVEFDEVGENGEVHLRDTTDGLSIRSERKSA
ncbi:MAG: chromosome segregation protein SMC [Thermoguttaceae bacterium]|nr:chromosome segregation protein SMC [Thermoguttaceae bacterium]